MSDERTDRQRVASAFMRLAARDGYYTDMGTYCCGNCTGAELAQRLKADGKPEAEWRVVHFNEQSDESAFGALRGGVLREALYLHWQNPEDDPAPIQAALEAEGLRVWAPENERYAILVLPAANRRHSFVRGPVDPPDAACLACGKARPGHRGEKQ